MVSLKSLYAPSPYWFMLRTMNFDNLLFKLLHYESKLFKFTCLFQNSW